MADTHRFPMLAGESRTEQVIGRSRFITSLCPVETDDAARAFIERIRSEFPDATHNCYAWLAGPPGSTSHVGMSDAGEPHGTAGRPMLNVLIHSGVGDVVAVVTRYFGGVKLGKGGLARAYGGCVKDAIEAARKAEKVAWSVLRIELEYSLLETLRRTVPAFRAEVLEEEFGERVQLKVRVPEDQAAELRSALRDASAGRVTIREQADPT